MNDRQENRLGMFEKVNAYLTNSIADLADTIIINDTIKPSFDAKLLAILDEEEDAGADTTGSTDLKQEIRHNVEGTGFGLSGALVSYFTIGVPDPVKRAKCRFTKSDLSRMRDTDLYVRMSLVHEFAQALGDGLEDYGYPATDITAYGDLLAQYFGFLQGPKDAIGSRSASGKQVDRLIDEMLEILELHLDPVMHYYAVANAELYDYYLSARSIDQSGGGVQPDFTDTDTVDSAQFMGHEFEPEVTLNSRLVFKNESPEGSVDLRISFDNTGGVTDGPVTRDIAPGETVDILFSQLGFNSTYTVFAIHNLATPTPVTGSYNYKVFY